MIIENPEYREETTHYEWGDDTSVSIVLPKGLPGKHGVTILVVSNLKYFLEMFTLGDYDRYFRPYEILANLEKQVMEDALNGEIAPSYLASYKRDPMSDGDVIIVRSTFILNIQVVHHERFVRRNIQSCSCF